MKTFMENHKSKNKLNIFLIPFLFCNQLLLPAYSNEYLLAQENYEEERSLIDEAIDELNPVMSDLKNKENENDLNNYIENDFNDISIKENEKQKQIKINNNNKNENKFKIISIPNSAKNNKFIPLPKSGDITVGEFQIPTRGYLKLKDKKISLDLIRANPYETLKLIAEKGNYGIIYVGERKEDDKIYSITAKFNQENISDVFNSILLASNLQAKVEKNIIFVGTDISNKSLEPNFSKTYRLNQANVASVADYLNSLGAQISKVLVKGSGIDGSEVGDNYKQADLKNNPISSYEKDGGPLSGLIGSVDTRLQTITLIGSKELIKTSDKYIKAMDRRHRQVALNIKIIDVSLTKTDLKDNVFEFLSGDTRVINNSGLSLFTTNTPFSAPTGGTVESFVNTGTGLATKSTWVNWLEAKIQNDNAKIMASPTLILGENSDPNVSGQAEVDDGLKEANIGRPYSNEGFIKVGETVITGFSKTTEDGVTTCTGQNGTAGITFGAKVDKIDDNGFVTFALSPAISSVTSTAEVAGCGIQSTLSVRKLDTGSIRVKNGNTLILTGVLKDEENVSTSKIPILGDLPILGSLFRNNSEVSRKSELIILVTPNILKDDVSNSTSF